MSWAAFGGMYQVAEHKVVEHKGEVDTWTGLKPITRVQV